jgi:hypothetical protein
VSVMKVTYVVWAARGTGIGMRRGVVRFNEPFRRSGLGSVRFSTHMSDHYLRYVPVNPEFQPARGDAAAAEGLLRGFCLGRNGLLGCFMRR